MVEEMNLLGSSKFRLLTATQLVQEQQQGALILDARDAERFASLHIRGSVQISLMGHFASWAAILIKPTQRLALVAENVQGVQEGQTRLKRIGLGRVIGYSLADETRWREEGIDLATISTHRCANVHQTLGHDPSVQLVDVRSRAEWLKGHLPGAISLPLLELDRKKRIIDRSKPSLVYCHEGYRATTAASILLRESTGDVGILFDGVEGWLALGLPLEMPDNGSFDRLSGARTLSADSAGGALIDEPR
jgi:rhodanese-related sulfurtransferase